MANSDSDDEDMDEDVVISDSDDEDMDDDSQRGYHSQPQPKSAACLQRPSGRRYSSTSPSSSTNNSPLRSWPSATLPAPIVPNLTKRSRGRRVPTMSFLEDLRSVAGKKRQTMSSVGGNAMRTYLCVVEGCGKAFARGEHLKRHVRSIHTHEKPHKCPYPGCGKGFNRHENLGQHMRVHKDYLQRGVTVAESGVTEGSMLD